MDDQRAIVKVGMEIEVPKWNGRTYYEVCKDLVDAQYMAGPAEQWRSHHKYHCSCEKGGCSLVRKGELVVPPLVSMTYDATLPKSGAEFIVSPVLLADTSLREMLHEIWDIIVRDAYWGLDMKNWYENDNSSPSVHLHISARATKEQDNTRSIGSVSNDIMHALSLFSPELFLLADGAGKRRGVKFRLPTRDAINNDPQGKHHGFIDIRQIIPKNMVYLEWRLFEAAYDDWDYIEGAGYLAASLTRSFLEDEVLSALMTTGYRYSYDSDMATKIALEDDTEKFLSLASRERLNLLRQISVEQLGDDAYGANLVKALFKRIEDRF